MRDPILTAALMVWYAAVFSFQGCDTFLFSDDCPVSSPCSCSGPADHALVLCSNKQLTSVPQFHTSQLHSKEVNIFFNDNNLTSIPNYVFRSLGSMNAASIHLKLDSNKINYIGTYAFDGIESAITILQLQNNRFTSLPATVGNLHNLNYLDITNNPFKYLGISAVSGIGQSLKTLYIDLSPFPVWPTELVSLRTLEHLTVSSIPYVYMNSSAFRGFENTLLTLNIEAAPRLKKIPCAMFQLSKLKSLYLDHFGQLGANGTSIFENCTQQSQSLSSFTLEHSNLTTFPEVFRHFPSLTSLNLLGNSLEFIEAEKIPSANKLAEIDLSSNNFKRIPSALNKVINLTDLDLTDNYIVSVEDVDLNGLSRLQELSLSGNPLRYISTHAFDNNKQLATLNLANTNLRLLPAAMTSLAQLTDLDISGVHITCSCEMSYLKSWDITSILSFDGVCANTNANVKNYITTYLKLCS